MLCLDAEIHGMASNQEIYLCQEISAFPDVYVTHVTSTQTMANKCMIQTCILKYQTHIYGSRRCCMVLVKS